MHAPVMLIVIGWGAANANSKKRTLHLRATCVQKRPDVCGKARRVWTDDCCVHEAILLSHTSPCPAWLTLTFSSAVRGPCTCAVALPRRTCVEHLEELGLNPSQAAEGPSTPWRNECRRPSLSAADILNAVGGRQSKAKPVTAVGWIEPRWPLTPQAARCQRPYLESVVSSELGSDLAVGHCLDPTWIIIAYAPRNEDDPGHGLSLLTCRRSPCLEGSLHSHLARALDPVTSTSLHKEFSGIPQKRAIKFVTLSISTAHRGTKRWTSRCENSQATLTMEIGPQPTGRPSQVRRGQSDRAVVLGAPRSCLSAMECSYLRDTGTQATGGLSTQVKATGMLAIPRPISCIADEHLTLSLSLLPPTAPVNGQVLVYAISGGKLRPKFTMAAARGTRNLPEHVRSLPARRQRQTRSVRAFSAAPAHLNRSRVWLLFDFTAHVTKVIQPRQREIQIHKPQNGGTCQKRVGKQFSNQCLVTYSPRGGSANRELFSASDRQLEARFVPELRAAYQRMTRSPTKFIKLETLRGPRCCSCQTAHLPPRRTALHYRWGHSTDFRMWDHAGHAACQQVSSGIPFPPPLNSGTSPYSPHFALIMYAPRHRLQSEARGAKDAGSHVGFPDFPLSLRPRNRHVEFRHRSDLSNGRHKYGRPACKGVEGEAQGRVRLVPRLPLGEVRVDDKTFVPHHPTRTFSPTMTACEGIHTTLANRGASNEQQFRPTTMAGLSVVRRIAGRLDVGRPQSADEPCSKQLGDLGQRACAGSPRMLADLRLLVRPWGPPCVERTSLRAVASPVDDFNAKTGEFKMAMVSGTGPNKMSGDQPQKLFDWVTGDVVRPTDSTVLLEIRTTLAPNAPENDFGETASEEIWEALNSEVFRVDEDD
ncbi:hypothetical protein PR048_026996 [Dryococelus australis]|uniref:Uncharacterized protein n=1 Tax=Dryococelus australis TaxID=614101 RepID=A0ABQ9GMW8_9NEOP|nr:hypothetical protein PR048_026996 [Dryococelus australis]